MGSGRSGTVLSVNIGQARRSRHTSVSVTGIDKRPVDRPVEIRAPGDRRTGLGSGLVGDVVCDRRHHGGDDQAVYAYAREDLDGWEPRLDRKLANGMFGENLTTAGIDVTGAVIGEHWRIGAALVLEVSCPRIPCRTFAGWLGTSGWVKTFTHAAVPGAYFRVVQAGPVQHGDSIEVTHRPAHDITIGLTFRALTLEPALLERLLVADALPEKDKIDVRQRLAKTAPVA